MQAAYRAWGIPSRPDLVAVATNAKSAGLKGDGITDDTAALQNLLNALPEGSTIYFPPAHYRIDGPITITKPFKLFGESGTLFDCQKATQYVFTINRQGSSEMPMEGMVITGIVFEGPGIETTPAIIDGHYLKNYKISYVKFHNIGYAAIRVRTSTDVVIENCIFDNVFQTGFGYGVAILDHSDNIFVRNNFFVTKGRHGVTLTTGNKDTLQETDYVRRVTVENNYFEYMTDAALDAHPVTIGPYIIKGNIINYCRLGISIHSGTAVVTDNLFTNSQYRGIYLPNEKVNPMSIGSKIDKVQHNTFINVTQAIQIHNTNVVIQDNIAQGNGQGTAILLGEANPEVNIVQGNILNNFNTHIYSCSPTPKVTLLENTFQIDGMYKFISEVECPSS